MNEELQKADNVLDEVEDVQQNLETDSPTEQQKDISQTKAFSERLKKERAKILKEERENLAQSLGYVNWEEYQENLKNDKLLNQGLDPEVINPLVKEFMKTDPEYQEALRYKKEKEELQKEIWAKNELTNLNAKFGTTFSDINQLDEDTIKLWNEGLSLDKAFAANNYDKIVKRKPSTVTGKEHLIKTEGSASTAGSRVTTPEELKYFKSLNPTATDEEIKAYINRNKK